MRSSIDREAEWDVCPDLFFYRDPEELEKAESPRPPPPREDPAAGWNAGAVPVDQVAPGPAAPPDAAMGAGFDAAAPAPPPAAAGGTRAPPRLPGDAGGWAPPPQCPPQVAGTTPPRRRRRTPAAGTKQRTNGAINQSIDGSFPSTSYYPYQHAFCRRRRVRRRPN